MGDQNTLLANIHKALARLFNTFYTNIAWTIKSGLEYPKDLNIVGTFQHLFIYITFLTSVKSGL